MVGVEIEIVEKPNAEPVRKKIGVTRLHMEEDAGKLTHGGERSH